MKLIYVLSNSPYHDNETLIGVFETAERGYSAIADHPLDDSWCEGVKLEAWDMHDQKSVGLVIKTRVDLGAEPQKRFEWYNAIGFSNSTRTTLEAVREWLLSLETPQ
jgi:hypothetical protein